MDLFLFVTLMYDYVRTEFPIKLFSLLKNVDFKRLERALTAQNRRINPFRPRVRRRTLKSVRVQPRITVPVRIRQVFYANVRPAERGSVILAEKNRFLRFSAVDTHWLVFSIRQAENERMKMAY